MNAGPTPTPRPAPPTISANKMRADPHRERRRGRAIQNAHRFARRPEYLGDLGFSKKNGRISG